MNDFVFCEMHYSAQNESESDMKSILMMTEAGSTIRHIMIVYSDILLSDAKTNIDRHLSV